MSDDEAITYLYKGWYICMRSAQVYYISHYHPEIKATIMGGGLLDCYACGTKCSREVWEHLIQVKKLLYKP